MKKTLLIAGCILIISQSSPFAQISFSNESGLLTTTGVISSHPCAVADFNGDGLDDIARLDGGVELYVNYQQENGMFNEFLFGAIEDNGFASNAWGMCVGDVDGNGRADIIAGGSYDDIKVIKSGNLDGQFTLEEINATGIFVQGITLFDVDYDGDLDIFACHNDGSSQLLMNDGSGHFSENNLDDVFDTTLFGEEEMNSGNRGCVWSDVNGDMKADNYISKTRLGISNPNDVRRINQLWMYDENNTYMEQGEEAGVDIGWQSWCSDFADIDNDGDMDLFIGNHDYDNMLFENLGNGIFTDISDASGISDLWSSIIIQSIFRDFDNDGWIDLLMCGGNEYVLARNNGDNTFTDAGPVFGSFGINSFACGDLNNDGRVDIYATEGGYGSMGNESPDGLFLNTTSGNENFVMVNLESEDGVPNGVGAIITCTLDGVTQMREVRSGESYGIQNSMMAHFGLGYTEQVYPTINVYWPSGIMDEFVATSYYTATITEGVTPTIMSEQNHNNTLLFPNPSSGNITLQSNEVSLIRLFDAQGQLVLEKESAGGIMFIERNNLPIGIYQLHIIKDNSSSSETHRVVFR